MPTMSAEPNEEPRRRRWFGLGIHLKLVIAGAVTTVFGITLVSTFLLSRQTRLINQEIVRSTVEMQGGLEDHGRLLVNSMAVSMGAAIVGQNFRFVTDSLNTIAERDPDLAYGYVANSVGTVVVHTDASQVGSNFQSIAPIDEERVVEKGDGISVTEVSRPIMAGDQIWGHLVLAFDMHRIKDSADMAAVRARKILVDSTMATVLYGLIVIVLGAMGSIYFSRSVLAPIRGLTDDAEAIASGNLDHEVRSVESSDEIGFLARQFELMRRSIQSYVEQLVIARDEAQAATKAEQHLRTQIERHSKLLEIKVQERTAELQEINRKLTENDRLKSEFLSNVSHELRSPLAAIASAAKIINRYGDENKRNGTKFSTVITEESGRLGRLINDLLDLAKIEAGRVEWNMVAIDNPTDLLGHVATTFRPLAQESEVELVLDAPAKLKGVTGDEDRLVQVLTNLCSNAMKYTPAGGRITIGGSIIEEEGAEFLRVTVQDTGPGIPDDEREKIFDRFHQVKTKKSDINKPKGTGLGLAICHEVVTHHGGRIWAEAPEDKGALIVFLLPCGTPDQAAAVAADEPPEEPPSEPLQAGA